MEIDTIDFHDHCDLENYIDKRYILDVDRFINGLELTSRYSLLKSDTVYDVFGRPLFSFSERAYWQDKEGNRTVVTDMTRLQRAKSNIYRSNGLVAMLYRDIKDKNYMPEPPDFFKAAQLVEVLIADAANGMYDHCLISKSINTIENSIDFDQIKGAEYDRVKREIECTQRRICEYLSQFAGHRSFKEVTIYYRNDELVMDVGLDIRIKEWYMAKFQKEEEERERIREGSDLERIRYGGH